MYKICSEIFSSRELKKIFSLKLLEELSRKVSKADEINKKVKL